MKSMANLYLKYFIDQAILYRQENHPIMSEQELRDGQVFRYMDQYETVDVDVRYSKTLEGFKAFKIRVNKEPVVITKDFIFVKSKLRELISKYGLIE